MRSTPLSLSVAAEIRAVCARQQIRQTDLATAIGMSQAALSTRMRGQAPFDLDQLTRACEFLETDVADLLRSAQAAVA